jgi:polysaccharide biosynthesis protein PslJ
VTALGAPIADNERTQRNRKALWIVLGVGITIAVATAGVRLQANPILGAMVAGLVLVSYQHVLLAWRTLLALILLVILFIPIRRYTVSGNLPFELEPYRIVIALVLACWLCALAADPAVRWRKTGLEAPIGALLISILISLSLNISRVNANQEVVVKQVTFFFSYFLIIYFIASVIRSRGNLDRMFRVLVGGGTIVALATLVEWRTGSNYFNWYSRAMPFLHYVDEGEAVVRGTGVRARGSAQHPIALGAAVVLLIPLAVYLYQRDKRRIWLACASILTLGALATGSRTGAIMLIALLVSFVCIKPKETVRLLPYLLPLMVVIQVVMPGTLGTFKSMLNPSYVLHEQSYDKGSGAGRVADLGPALDQWSRTPFFGSGFGTRVADSNAQAGAEGQILDDQWLGTLLEIGLFGTLSLLWLYVRAIRRLTARARSSTGPDGWLMVALASAIIALAVGMLTFDAFAFVQVTFISFVFLGFAAAATADPDEDEGQAPSRWLRPLAALR